MTLQQIGLVAVMLCAMATAARAQEIDASEDTENALGKMDKTYTAGHPDLYNEFAGMHDYASGEFKTAFEYFLKAAQYADKPSQLSIGLMYLSGQGVEKDPVKAYGWVAVAAERKYPTFVATQKQIWNSLTPQQQLQAGAYQKSLYAQYGDPTTKPRELQAMRDSWASLQTISNTWAYISGAVSKYGASGKIYIALGHATPYVQNVGKGEAIPKKWLWNPKSYFAVRDAQWMTDSIKGHGAEWSNGSVTVGPLQNVSGSSADDDGSSSTSSPQ